MRFVATSTGCHPRPRLREDKLRRDYPGQAERTHRGMGPRLRGGDSWRMFRATMLALMFLFTSQPALAYELPKPKLMAVYFWASWCPNCKLLTPEVASARKDGDFDNGPILFVTMDLSDSATIHQSVLLAQALGIAPFVQAQGSATGYVAILDAVTKKELKRFDRTNKAADIEAWLKAELEKSAPKAEK